MSLEFMQPPASTSEYTAERSLVYAVRADNILYTSGMNARSADGEIVGKGDIAAQAVQTYENLKAVLERAGATLADVISTRTCLVDREHKFAVRPIRAHYFPGPNRPTSALYVVAGLSDPDYLIEIEAIAYLGPK